jgi:putative peptide zinc metalloprotease protein
VRLRLHLYDPSALLRRLEPLGRTLFSARGALFAAGFGLLALVLSLEGADRLRADVARSLSHPLFFLGVATGVTFLHELGHGLACHCYGGRVRDVGVMLMYLCIPAAYCDVSDAHLFESQKRRAVVAMAGCYVNLLLWTLAVFVWRVFEPDLLITRIALGVIATTSLSLFFNLNPLLPLDGYYAFSELLGVQNLRERAQRNGIYRLYRWCRWIYLGLVLPVAMVHLFGFLVARFRMAGFLAFLVLFCLSLRPLARSAWRWVMAA